MTNFIFGALVCFLALVLVGRIENHGGFSEYVDSISKKEDAITLKDVKRFCNGDNICISNILIELERFDGYQNTKNK